MIALKVATTELKLMCAFDHIENLKRENKWSFRQYKKSRVSAGLIKTHWDYLMDEMVGIIILPVNLILTLSAIEMAPSRFSGRKAMEDRSRL